MDFHSRIFRLCFQETCVLKKDYRFQETNLLQYYRFLSKLPTAVGSFTPVKIKVTRLLSARTESVSLSTSVDFPGIHKKTEVPIDLG